MGAERERIRTPGAVDSVVYHHFNLRHPLCSRDNFKLNRAAALVQWRQLGAA